MNTYLRNSTLALAAVLALTSASAQKTENKEKDKKKTQSITIVRTGESDEKIVVEVNGDKVTVNGKPVEEYKGENIKVITGDAAQYRLAPGRALAAMKGIRTPMAIAGVEGDHFFSWGENHARLGVSTEDGEGGAKVTEVTKESAAEKAGLKAGDIITKVNEFNVADADDLPMAINKFKPEDKVTITYKRDGVEATTSATLGKNDHPFATTYAMADHDFNFDFGNGAKSFYSRKPRLGVQIEDMEEGNGVKILEVNAETPAGKAGLQKDDVITSFNGKEIKGVDDIRGAMKDMEEGETVKVSYRRGTASQNTEIKFPKAVKKANL
jgi:serine protease Do